MTGAARSGMMRGVKSGSLALALAVAAGCGKSRPTTGQVCPGVMVAPPALGADLTGGFTGGWQGALATVIDGRTERGSGAITVSRTGENVLGLSGVCTGTLPATVASAAAFETICFACPAMALGGCSSAVVTYQPGTATLDAGTLTLTLPGRAEGCGETTPFTQTLTATRVAAVSGAPEAEPDGAEGGLAAALAR